ncbi:hypothetical protein [Promineifilum sp.]|uniref:hypothetical protein n=1 Tax=Promineifilum sp. TaxID=2664178 RepID=UPI0035AD99D5
MKTRVLLITLIFLLALGLRETAVRTMRTDFDEPVYFEAGLRYAGALREGDLARLVNDDFHAEHPGLVKLLYAAALFPYGRSPDALPDLPELTELADLPPPLQPMTLSARRASELFSLLHVLLLAAVSPAAGALLAIHTYTIKYTTQIYLEALPMFTATVCVLAYIRAGKSSRKGREGDQERKEERVFSWRSWRPSRSLREPLLWWALSAVALGLTAAGKYVYGVAGLAVAADYSWRQVRPTFRGGLPLGVLTAWGGLALLVFYAANPYLWPDPLGRLGASILFHVNYTDSAIVASVGYPWYQPFVWLFRPMPALWHPGLFPVALDGVIAAAGLVGVWPAWRAWEGRGRVIVLWWGIGLAFLLLWGTKWPQYSLIMTAPMCLCAGEALRWGWASVTGQLNKRTTDSHGFSG